MKNARVITMSDKRFRHNLFSGAAIIFFLALFGMFPLLLDMPKANPDKADAIVVLGGGTGDRVSKSLELYEAGFATRIVLTGSKEPTSFQESEMQDDRADFLKRRDVSADRIFFVLPSSDSWLEAKSTLALMHRLNWKKVIVVSDPPHMLRLSYAWGRAFRGHPEIFVLVATAPEWWAPLTWWGNRTSFWFVISEAMKLGYYVIAY